MALLMSLQRYARRRRPRVPRSCTICEHPDREAIDRALVGDSSNLSVSSLFGVSESAVRRHKANHLPAKLVMAQAAEEVAQADDLLQQVRDQIGRASCRERV